MEITTRSRKAIICVSRTVQSLGASEDVTVLHEKVLCGSNNWQSFYVPQSLCLSIVEYFLGYFHHTQTFYKFSTRGHNQLTHTLALCLPGAVPIPLPKSCLLPPIPATKNSNAYQHQGRQRTQTVGPRVYGCGLGHFPERIFYHCVLEKTGRLFSTRRESTAFWATPPLRDWETSASIHQWACTRERERERPSQRRPSALTKGIFSRPKNSCCSEKRLGQRDKDTNAGSQR